MIGKLLSTTLKIVTLPVDVANTGLDIIAGGDGSKESRMQTDRDPVTMLEMLRDRTAETLENIDK